MHMISKKDLSDNEMDTLTKSCSPTIVITANGEVQTHEEATVYVKELDIFCRSIMHYTSYLRTKDCTNNGYVTNMLEHITMINIDTGVHMISHNTQT